MLSNTVVAVQGQRSVCTHSPPSRCGFLLKKLIIFQLVMKFWALCKIRSFNATFTTVKLMPSHCVSWKCVLILSFHASLLFLIFYSFFHLNFLRLLSRIVSGNNSPFRDQPRASVVTAMLHKLELCIL